MAVTMMSQDWATRNSFAEAPQPCNIGELGRHEEAEVVEFLSARPLHTAFMMGLIRDNGLLSPKNRGSFYGSRNRSGQLEAVALIGHATMVEAHTESSLIAVARVARNCNNTHLIRGEQQSIKIFWTYFSGNATEPRAVACESLFELSELPSQCPDLTLRPATMSDFDKVVTVNASMALEECGSSPLQRDPNGFRKRTARRIEQNRVWVLVENNRLVFKADVVSATPEVTYLEGIYVHPEERRQGHASRCLTKLSSMLLATTKSICLTVNDQNKQAVALYEKVGFKFHSNYETIYLR
ncbi:MAG TPA: GNAT family N-acetyltransferase [Pyrinomonadaceae bacterium]|nr:GNAT family N-acetyltransferase [Pyrinomonadaceae bacterium]